MGILSHSQHWATWIVLISVLLFTLPRISIRFAAPGSFALAVSFPIVLGIYSVQGAGLHVTSFAAVLIAGIVFTLTLSTTLSDRPDMALRHLIIYSAAVFLGIAFAGHNVWPVVTVAAIIHSVFICTPLAKRNAGLMGNSNFAGAFLAPCAFIALYIDQPACAGLFAFALFVTKCRGAIFGLVVSSLFLDPIAAALYVAVLAILFFLKVLAWPWPTLKTRMRMWNSSGKYLIIKRFFFGMGGDVGRILFMKDRTQKSRMRRLHSDIIQGVFDGGIFYVGLYLWIGIYSITTAPPALAAALSCLMIAGLFIDTQLVHYTSVLFWLLVGQINYAAVPFVTLAPWMIPIAIIVLALAIQTWGRAFLADTLLGIGMNRKDSRWVAMAHKINPDDSFATVNIVRVMIKLKQWGPAFDRAWRMVDRYDADLKPEIPYYVLAAAALNVGAVPIAKAMATQTLKYGPNKGASELLGKIRQREAAKRGKQ